MTLRALFSLPLSVLLLLSPLPSWAVTMTSLTSGSSTTDGTSYASASITPSANKLILACFYNRDTTPGTVTAAGNGLTWVAIANDTVGTIDDDQGRITLFRAMGSAPSSGAVTFTVSQTALNAGWGIAEFGDVDTGGTNGSAAIVQNTINSESSVTTLTATLGDFSNANNATYGCFAITLHVTPAGVTPGTGFTEISDVSIDDAGTLDDGSLQTEWRSDNDTTVDASVAPQSDWGIVAVEIKHAAAADTFFTRRPLRGGP